MLIASSLVRTGIIRQSGQGSEVQYPFFSFSSNPVNGSAVRVFPLRGSALYSTYDTALFKTRTYLSAQADVYSATLLCEVRTEWVARSSITAAPFIDEVLTQTDVDAPLLGVTINSACVHPVNMSTLFKSLWSVFAEVWPMLKHNSKADITNTLFKYDGYYEMYRTEDCSVLS